MYFKVRWLAFPPCLPNYASPHTLQLLNLSEMHPSTPHTTPSTPLTEPTKPSSETQLYPKHNHTHNPADNEAFHGERKGRHQKHPPSGWMRLDPKGYISRILVCPGNARRKFDIDNHNRGAWWIPIEGNRGPIVKCNAHRGNRNFHIVPLDPVRGGKVVHRYGC